MTRSSLAESAAFPAVVTAAFFVRNAVVMVALGAVAMFALLSG